MAQIGFPNPTNLSPDETDTIEGSIEMIAKRNAKMMAD